MKKAWLIAIALFLIIAVASCGNTDESTQLGEIVVTTAEVNTVDEIEMLAPDPLLTETEVAVEEAEKPTISEEIPEPVYIKYAINRSSGKIHKLTCGSVDTMKDENKMFHTGTIDELLDQGYTRCGKCKPY